MTDLPIKSLFRYKGYWIHYSYLSKRFWIEKDGHHIGYCSGLEDGKSIINILVSE